MSLPCARAMVMNANDEEGTGLRNSTSNYDNSVKLKVDVLPLNAPQRGDLPVRGMDLDLCGLRPPCDP